MPAAKVRQSRTRDKRASPTEYDHYVALDWSLKIMAIAHMNRGDEHPRVFERPTDIKQLKLYLKSLAGRVIITFEESGSALAVSGTGGDRRPNPDLRPLPKQLALAWPEDRQDRCR